AAAPGRQPGRLGGGTEPDPDAPGDNTRPDLRGGGHGRRGPRHSRPGPRLRRGGHHRWWRRRGRALRPVCQVTARSRVRILDEDDSREVQPAERAALAWVTTYEHIHVGTRNPAGGTGPSRRPG